MEEVDEPEWLKAERADQRGSRARLLGMYAARPWVVAPVLVALPITWFFGEAAYVIPLLGVAWMTLAFAGIRMHRRASPGEVRRSQGCWIAVPSLLMGAALLIFSIACAVTGSWP